MRAFSILLVLIIAFSLGISGCAKNSPMQNLGTAAINETVNSDESIIVFFIPAKQHRLHVPIVETDENGNLGFVTILVPGTKYLHRTTPGKHFYFLSTVQGWSEMLEASVEAGKIYYTCVSQHPNSRNPDSPRQYFNSFQFLPVSDVTDEPFTKDVALCRWYQNTGAAKDWFERNLPDQQRRSAQARARHQETGSKKIISPEYGTTTLVQ